MKPGGIQIAKKGAKSGGQLVDVTLQDDRSAAADRLMRLGAEMLYALHIKILWNILK